MFPRFTVNAPRMGQTLMAATLVGLAGSITLSTVLDFLVPPAQAATEGAFNNFFGTFAGDNNDGDNATAFFGGFAGQENTTGINNSFFGSDAGNANTTGSSNSFFGRTAGFFNTTGSDNAFFGAFAGASNTNGQANTIIGTLSDGAAGISNATALGFRAKVTQSNSLVLGSINGVNDATADTDVGIGVTAPAAPLHVRRFNNTAQVLVEDTGTSSVQTMFSLINNGHPKFRLEDASQSDVRWEFRTAGTKEGDERFQVNKVGTGFINAEFLADGDLVIAGSYLTSSSLTVKDHITHLDAATVLAKLEALPLHEWSYKASPASRHAGPMAEDWHAAFGFGPDDRHVSPTDLAGVALAAAKALKAENESLRNELETLKLAVAKLERLNRQ